MRLPARFRESPLLTLVSPLLPPHRGRLTLVLLVMPVSSVMAMMVPYLLKVAIDDFIVPATESGEVAAIYEQLSSLVLMAAVVVVVGYLADAIYVSNVQRIGQTLIAQLRELVYKRTLRLPRSYFDKHPIGTVLTRVTSDIEALGESLATGAISLFVDFLKATAYLSMMFVLNWKLSLIMLLLLPVITFLIMFFQQRVRSSFFVARQALSDATGYLQECLSGIKTVQLYGAEKVALNRYKEKNRKFLHAQNASNLYDALLFSLVEGVTSLAIALLLWYSAGELLAGFLTLGVLVAFMEYVQRLLVPVREFTQQLAVLQRAMAALDHIDEICRVPLDPAEVLSTETAQTGNQPEMEGFQSLVFEDVWFRYTEDGPWILKGVSFQLERGKTLAVVGATGSGKSTIIRLLTRGYGGYKGSIKINGVELTDVSADQLGKMVSMVHQNVFLYQGSAEFNIGLARPSVSNAQVIQAAQYVNADTFISKLERSYDSEIMQGGVNLSAGQGQLISLARAVVAQTDLIVLDEATSSVDSMTEKLIQDAVGRLYHDKTVIAIAHRLSTIRNSNTILAMEAGVIKESGSHQELMAKGGLYADLVGKLEQEQEIIG